MKGSNMKDGANFIRHEMGMNVIPADTKNKRPIVEWRQFQTEGVTNELHQEWIDNDMFNGGMAVICGRVRHNEQKSGIYLNGIDFDNELAIREFCNINGKQHTLEELADTGHLIIERHSDDKTKAHVYVWSKKPFKKKAPTATSNPAVPMIEVKGRGEDGLMFISPSIHKNGGKYEFIGKYREAIREPKLHDEIVYHLEKILNRYGISYLNGKAEAEQGEKSTGRMGVSIKNNIDEKVHEGARHNFILRYADSTLKRLYDTTPPDIIKKMFQEVNLKRCKPPLEEKEINQI